MVCIGVRRFMPSLLVRFAHSLRKGHSRLKSGKLPHPTRSRLLFAGLRPARMVRGLRSALSPFASLRVGLSRGLPLWPESPAGGSYSPFAFNVLRFKRTPTGAPPPSPVWLRRRYRHPMFFAVARLRLAGSQKSEISGDGVVVGVVLVVAFQALEALVLAVVRVREPTV